MHQTRDAGEKRKRYGYQTDNSIETKIGSINQFYTQQSFDDENVNLVKSTMKIITCRQITKLLSLKVNKNILVKNVMLRIDQSTTEWLCRRRRQSKIKEMRSTKKLEEKSSNAVQWNISRDKADKLALWQKCSLANSPTVSDSTVSFLFLPGKQTQSADKEIKRQRIVRANDN